MGWTSGSPKANRALAWPSETGIHQDSDCGSTGNRKPQAGERKGRLASHRPRSLLAHLLETLPVDADRVYLTGNSMGGYGTFMWAGYRPAISPPLHPWSAEWPLGPRVTKDLDLWAKLGQLPCGPTTEEGPGGTR